MKGRIKTIIAILVFSLAFTGCQKKGDIGPAGKDGKDGNANMSHSSPFIITNFTYNSTTKQYAASLTQASITQQVVDGGIVALYLQDASSWLALPINTGHDVLMYEFQLGGITVYYYNSDGSVPSNPNGLFTIRSVVIPPQIVKQNPNVNWNDYKESDAVLDL
jgi:hypothetical protein